MWLRRLATVRLQDWVSESDHLSRFKNRSANISENNFSCSLLYTPLTDVAGNLVISLARVACWVREYLSTSGMLQINTLSAASTFLRPFSEQRTGVVEVNQFYICSRSEPVISGPGSAIFQLLSKKHVFKVRLQRLGQPARDSILSSKHFHLLVLSTE